MVNLENVTLVAMTSVKISETIKALEFSCRGVKFGKVKLVSDIKPDNLPDYIQHEYTERMNNIDEWNYSSIYKLGKHIDTEFVMLIHDDGFVINPDSWRDDFLDYDYVGAPWKIPINGEYVGNGGLSLRKKSKMLEIVNNCKVKDENNNYLMEDRVFSYSCNNIPVYKPSEEEASQFSIEGVISNKSFGLHKSYDYLDKNEINNVKGWCPEIEKLTELNKK